MSMPKTDVGERKSELVAAIDELDTAISGLRQATDALVERISPLCRTDNPADVGRNVPDSCTQVTQGLRVRISELHIITDILNSAYTRVEI